MADLIDPTQTGNYPVVLGDGLLGKQADNIFTGVRYNHKPPQNESGPSRNARLQPSIRGQTSSYNLELNDRDNRAEYTFTGARNTSDDQYVLYFDPERKVFVLDRIDSTFNMNVTRVPGNSDQDSLSRKYPPLENIGLQSGSSAASSSAAKPKVAEVASKPKPRAKSPPRKKDAPPSKPKAKPKKEQTKKATPAAPLALPTKADPKPKPKPKPRNLEEEEEEEDEDDGLLIEYPGGEPRGPKRDFSPALKSIRRFDDFMDQRESEADDADGESESEPEIVDFKLPSPANGESNGRENRYHDPEPMDEDSEEDEDQGGAGVEGDLEDDLEKDLEMAFEAADNSFNGTPVNDDVDESEISEED